MRPERADARWRAHHHSGRAGEGETARRSAAQRVTRDVANAESPTSAWVTRPVEQPAEKTSKPAEQTPAKEMTPPIKAAEPAGSLPSFRWPARGPLIARFGPQPGGLQNDGIDVAMPNGTPVKAADDGVSPTREMS